jgi:Spy/CpxP family protein refolding chaperone
MTLTLVLSVLVAGLGAWGGAEFVMRRVHQPTPLHELVHEKLNLTPDQQRRIAGMEREHESRRQTLEAQMRAANAELARALVQHHAFTPEVQTAVDHFHGAMGELQKETIVHTLAMRSVLTPEQAVRFDQAIVESLTEKAR